MNSQDLENTGICAPGWEPFINDDFLIVNQFLINQGLDPTCPTVKSFQRIHQAFMAREELDEKCGRLREFGKKAIEELRCYEATGINYGYADKFEKELENI